MTDPDEYPINGVASTTPQTLDFGIQAVEINFVNDGANSIYVSFKDSLVSNGIEVKSGESRSWGNTASRNGRRFLYLKTTSSTSAFHGEAVR